MDDNTSKKEITKSKIESLRKRIKTSEINATIPPNDGPIRNTSGIKDVATSEKFETLGKNAHLQELKWSAIVFDSEQKYYHDAETLLKEMSEVSRKQGKPVLSSWNGKEFVIGKNSTHRKACEAWGEQTFDLNNCSYEQLQLFSTGDFLINVPDKGILYETQDRKIAEAIMVNYPEKAETLDTIQIHGVYLSNFGNNRGNTAEALLRKSIDEYMSGKETFKPNIYNVAQLDELREFAFISGMYSLEDLDKRIAETRKDMLATIDEWKIRFLSDDALTFVSQIAEKYPEDKVAKGVRQASQREITQRNNEKSRDL